MRLCGSFPAPGSPFSGGLAAGQPPRGGANQPAGTEKAHAAQRLALRCLLRTRVAAGDFDSAEREASKRKSTAAFEQTPLYRRVVGHPNVRRFASLIEQSARARALDPSLIMAIIAVESAFEPGAMSTKGALGLMQIIPATAVRYGVVERPGRTVAQQLLDPATNVRIGVCYLRDLLYQFNDDLPLALAAYNAGE